MMIAVPMWWNQSEARWERIKETYFGDFPRRPDATIGVPPGDHFFMLCFVEDGETVNAIPHRYEIGSGGVVLRTIGGLSEAEENEMARLMTEAKTPEEVERYNELGEKWVSIMRPVRTAFESFLRDLPAPPVKDRSYGIWKRIADMGGGQVVELRKR